jgi:hypothetical protein
VGASSSIPYTIGTVPKLPLKKIGVELQIPFWIYNGRDAGKTMAQAGESLSSFLHSGTAS